MEFSKTHQGQDWYCISTLTPQGYHHWETQAKNPYQSAMAYVTEHGDPRRPQIAPESGLCDLIVTEEQGGQMRCWRYRLISN